MTDSLKNKVINEILEKVNEAFFKIDQCDDLIARKRVEIDILKGNEDSLLLTIKQLELTKSALESLTEQKSSENRALKELMSEVVKIREDWNSESSRIFLEKAILLKELSSIKNEYESYLLKFRPTIEELNRREVELSKKESDLLTIQNRWERRFASKGRRFKVT